jgi:membrane protein
VFPNVADEQTTGTSTARGITTRVLTTLGLFAAGFVAANVLQKPRAKVRGFFDRILRRLVFQAKTENLRTQSRTALSLVHELSTSLYKRIVFEHNISSVAASAAFFVVLALFPGLAALVSLYGFLGDPADIRTFIATMPEIVPKDVVQLVQDFLSQLISRPGKNLGTFVVSLTIALWSANSGMKALIEALNVVYERKEHRSFFRLNALSAVMTFAFLVFMIVAVNIMILPIADWLRQAFGDALLGLRWLIALLAVQFMISALFYFAPYGRQRKWQVLTAGALLAAVMWIWLSMLFSYYLTSFANYSVTYGSLGAAAIFMTWLWLTVMTLLIGAEVDAAIENLGQGAEGSENGK